jgi:nucleotide-binding universal stress UspA family protein
MTIVVGFSVTAEGRAALERGIDEAQLRDGKLVVVRSTRGGARDESEMANQLKAEFNQLEQRLSEAGVDFELRSLVRGAEPAEDLLRFADDVDAQLIVIGIRRRSPVGKLLLGSNAQEIILNAECPVLAVKAVGE